MIKLKNIIALAEDADCIEIFYKNGDTVELLDEKSKNEVIVEEYLRTLPVEEVISVHYVNRDSYDEIFSEKNGEKETFEDKYLPSTDVLVIFLYPVEFWNH